jgi:hypothetical protein
MTMRVTGVWVLPGSGPVFPQQPLEEKERQRERERERGSRQATGDSVAAVHLHVLRSLALGFQVNK